MAKFIFLNYCTRYKVEGTENRDYINGTACFSPIFWGPKKQNNKYKIIISLDKENLNKGRDNYCFLTIKEIKNYISSLKHIVNIRFRYDYDENLKEFTIRFSYKGNIIYHKFILCYIRYLYEFPFNVVMYDLNKIRKDKIPILHRLSAFNLFHLIYSSIRAGNDRNGLHSIIDYHEVLSFYTYKQIKEQLDKSVKENITQINDVFNNIDVEFGVIDISNIDTDSINVKFKNRVETYLNNYKLVREYK